MYVELSIYKYESPLCKISAKMQFQQCQFSDVIWVSLCLKSAAAWLFVEQLNPANNIKTLKI